MNKEIKISREDLHKKVWSTPMIKLAREFGISDVGLKKVCKKLNIPTPGIGYWRKVELGKKIKAQSLPPANENTIRIHTFYPHIRENNDIAAKHKTMRKNEILKIPDSSSQNNTLEPEVNRTIKSLTPDNKFNHILTNRGEDTLAISISKEYMQRAFNIYNILIKTIREVGYPVKANGCTVIEIMDEEIYIVLKEKFIRTMIPQNNSIFPTREDYIPSGVLFITVLNDYSSDYTRRNFKDGKTKLEEKISELVAELPVIATAIKEQKQRRAEEERKWELRRQHYRREELLARREERRKEKFHKDFDKWLLSQKVDEFIMIYEEEVFKKETDQKKRIQQRKKINWMRKYSRELNPFIKNSLRL